MEKKSVTEAIQYQEERFTKKILFQKGDSVVFILNFMPGQQLPAHTHPGAEVYIYALRGSGTITVNDREEDFTEEEVIHIAENESFAFRNSSNLPASLHVVISKLPSPAYAKEIK
jgi:quercetin dioxygenase-like cupin family protein